MEKWKHIAGEWRRRAQGYRTAADQSDNPEARATFHRRAAFYAGLVADLAAEPRDRALPPDRDAS